MPFLRWAGGKQALCSLLVRALPAGFRELYYVEPFVGAGTLFFAATPQRARITDANPHLMSCYKQVRDRPELVFHYLQTHARKNSETYYYATRERYNSLPESTAQAARFIYLNKTCFNGIFRVNSSGAFNVPYGRKEPPALPSREELMRASKILQRAEIHVASWEAEIPKIGKGDFLFVDPPYPPLNGTSYFTHYTKERFSSDDQCSLATAVLAAADRGARVLVTIADTPLTRRLYSELNKSKVSVTRYVTCKSTKHKVEELVLTNYPVQASQEHK